MGGDRTAADGDLGLTQEGEVFQFVKLSVIDSRKEWWTSLMSSAIH